MTTHHAPRLDQQLILVAQCVEGVLKGRSLTDLLLAVKPALKPGVQALSYEVMRQLGTAQAVLSLLVSKKPSPDVQALLLTALALRVMPDAADFSYEAHTLINQAVEAAKKKFRHQSSFVNAVLRRFERERDELVTTAQRNEAARFNYPAWWINRVKHDWPQQAHFLLEQGRLRAPMTLRVNARHMDATAYVEILQQAHLSGQVQGRYTVILDRPCAVPLLPGFSEGWVSVQDASAQLAADLLGIESLPPQARVLDACAAPGGKTAQLLERADLQLTALDIDASRLEKVSDNLRRCGLTAKLIAADAAEIETWWDGELFDAILLDAPCSASGIVRRHPDIPWLRREVDITQLAAIQKKLLDSLWSLVKPSGRLLYATCSLFKVEGQEQFDAFLQRTPDAISRPSVGHTLIMDHNSTVGSAASTADAFFYGLAEKTPS